MTSKYDFPEALFTGSTNQYEPNWAKMRISEVFSERRGIYINEFNLFLLHFNYVPNFINEVGINCKTARIWFEDVFKDDIKDYYFSRRYFKQGRKAELDDVFYFLYEDLIVDFDTNCSTVRFLFRKTDLEKVERIITAISGFRMKKGRSKPEISLLISSQSGIETKSLEISKPKLSIDDNYNDDFKDIHKIICKRLSKKNDKGLVLLHGKPGTGKTSYIRYLITTVKKPVIFLPPNMAAAITNPDLISVLIDNPNSIFVIEDAENILFDRQQNGHSPVSALLNISDGLLADCLNVQLVCSFNTDISKVDPALMRKGRLIAKYEFKELETEKARKLSAKLGFKNPVNGPLTLTEIYNREEADYSPARRLSSIGFKAESRVEVA